MKPLVFLGAGVSLPSLGETGSVDSLTNALFDEPWTRAPSGEWHPATTSSPAAFHQPKCQEFLARLREQTANYYSNDSRPPINYEDLYFLADQLCDESGWTDNAAIEPFRVALSGLTSDLYGSPGDGGFEELCRETLNFIQYVIATKLRKKVPVVGFDLLRTLAALPGRNPLTICTLNHDLLIERFLEDEFIPYLDGFKQTPEYGIRYFDRGEFNRDGSKAKLLKLHGSLNWWRFRPNNGGFDDEQTGIPTATWDECLNKRGKPFRPMDSLPRFLTGYGNKLVAYQGDIFLAQMREFDRALDEHNKIVMSGYGWGDNGVNIRLKNWIWEKPDRQIILLHEEPEILRPRRALQHFFDEMVAQGRLMLLRKFMGHVEDSEVLKLL